MSYMIDYRIAWSNRHVYLHSPLYIVFLEFINNVLINKVNIVCIVVYYCIQIAFFVQVLTFSYPLTLAGKCCVVLDYHKFSYFSIQ